MDNYIADSILNIFFNCLSTTANPESLYVYFKMASYIYLHIGFCWNSTSDNTFIQNVVEYVKVR